MPDETHQVLFIIDEAAHLGRIQALEDAVTLLRGMGVRLFFFFQSLQQLQVCYGDNAAAVLDNLDTQIYFGTNAYETAEAISKRIGDMTVAVQSRSDSTSTSHPTGGGNPQQGGSRSASHTLNSNEIARRVLRPEEILTLPEEVALVFHRNLHVIPARLLRYYDAPEFQKGRAGRQKGPGLAAAVASLLVLAASLAYGVAVGEVTDRYLPAASRPASVRAPSGRAVPAPTARPEAGSRKAKRPLRRVGSLIEVR